MHSYPLVSSEGCTWRPLPTLYINTEPTLRLLANLEPFPSGSSELRRSAMDNRHDSETVRYTTNPSSRTLIFYASCMCTFLFLFLMVILYIVLFEVLSYISNLAIKCGTSRNKCAACFQAIQQGGASGGTYEGFISLGAWAEVWDMPKAMQISWISQGTSNRWAMYEVERNWDSSIIFVVEVRIDPISFLKDHFRRLNVQGYSALEDVIYAWTSSNVQMLFEFTVEHANSPVLFRWVI